MRRRTLPPTTRRRSRKAAALASLLPLAISMIPSGAPITSPISSNLTEARERQPRTRKAAPKTFIIPLSNLRDWAKTVVVTFDNVSIEGNSAVHALEDDCELHFGAHTPEFQGQPNGLVLEPMNACVEDPPPSFQSWSAFAKSIKDKTVTASGVPRVWPEHLEGGTKSNPDHTVELHPLTAIVAAGNTFDFAMNVFAGEYAGKVNNQRIVERVNVSVTTNGESVDISFQGGQIGNFTTLNLLIDRASITSDGDGSFRMNGEVAVDDSTTIPVRIVTVKGSPINESMPEIKRRRGETEGMDGALVLYSLSPEALLDAASRSNGNSVVVDRPIQLILYGMPDT